MAWLVLVASGLMETAWATALSSSKGFSRLVPSVVFVVTLAASMTGLAYSLRSIPVGTGYAVWVGIGAVGTALVGMIWLREPVTVDRLLCLLLVVAGVAGLKFLH